MAKITAASYISGISGKVCRHSQDEFRTNSSSGVITLSKKCNPYSGDATEAQKAQQTKFSARTAVVRQWLTTNRPTSTNTKGTDLYQEALSLKKSLQMSNITQVLSLYQSKSAPYAVTLPSEGGVRNDKTSDTGGSGDNPEGNI